MTNDKDHIQIVNNEAQRRENLPVLLKQVKDNSLSILLAHLENLFSSCDDLFFDLSSRAASNSEQNLYFESMREVRLKKNGVIAAFKREFEAGFYKLSDGGSELTASASVMTETNPNGLSLVQNDILEQDVAISSMVTKTRANCQESLYHLNLRFDYLIPNTAVNEQNNPMDPQQMCRYFATACELLELNIKARIIIFKQFDRFVASKLATLYSAANNLLIEAGVLPKTTGRPKTSSRNQPATGTSTQTHGIDQHVELELAELSNLLANIRQSSAASLTNYVSYSNNPGPALANSELIELLSSIQRSLNPPSTEELQLAQNLHNIVNNLLSDHGNKPHQALHQPEEDVINLVAMFFDFVLDDRNLPVPMQALISRLQIPVLKIALRDKTFFSNGSHPARKFINTIADASMGWDDSEQAHKDRLYDKIAKAVQLISDQYQDDENIFAHQLAELQTYLEQTQHKSSLVQKRTAQVAEGQAKTKLAKETSQELMFKKLEAVTLPDSISEFLTQQWLNLLVITHLKHGTDSPEWVDAVQIVDDLVWVSQLPDDPKSQQRFKKIKPDLLSRISKGLQQVSNTTEAVTELIKSIEHSLDKLQANSPDIQLRPLNAAQAHELGHTPGGGSKSWQEMTGVERQQARYKELAYDYILKAEQLPLNTWISYTDNASGKALRCKLSARIEQSDSYIFVNRFGFKALEKMRKDFACDMQAGRAVILESGQLFDRAMSSMLDTLKRGESSSPA